MHFTTWSILYNMFKPTLLMLRRSPWRSMKPKKVCDVTYDGEKVVVTYPDTKTGVFKTIRADSAIGADGGNSTPRKTVLPCISPIHVGYATWRGAVPVTSASAASRKALENQVLVFRIEKGYTTL